MNDFSAETTRLLESARLAGGGLSDARRERIKASVLTQIAAVGVASSIGIGSASLASAAGAGKGVGITATLIKAVSAVALLAATGAGVYSIAHTAEPPTPRAAVPAVQPQVAHAPAPLKATAPEPAAPEAVTPEAAAVPDAERPLDKPSAPRAASAPAAAAVTPETLAEETRLIREADQALRAGGAARALTLLDEHQRRFPRGVLAPERSAERLLARCQLGHVDAKAAAAYLAARPSSAFAARIRDACAVK
jgi:hypothetical protein